MKNKMRDNEMDIVFLLDRSGSMSEIGRASCRERV